MSGTWNHIKRTDSFRAFFLAIDIFQSSRYLNYWGKRP